MEELFGLTKLRARPPERAPIRTRESGVTQSAWRIAVECDQGTGAVVRAEVGTQQAYRGDGIFLGWPQDKLAAVYAALVAQRDEPPFDLPQLG